MPDLNVVKSLALALLTCTACTSSSSGGGGEGYGYEFSPDSEKQAAAAPNKAAAAQTQNADRRLPPETIQSNIRAHFSAMRTCYESGLKTDPKLTGTVVTRFVLGEDGLVKEAVADKSSTMSDPKVVECVVGELRNVSYPKTASGNITVVYPIVFTP